MTSPRRRRLTITNRNVGGNYGIVLGMYPSRDPTFGIELQRSNPGSTAFNTIFKVEDTRHKNEIRHIDYLPNDRRDRSYRARHIKIGWTPGSWTDTVAGTPAELPDGDVPTPNVSDKGVPVTLRLVKTEGVYSQPNSVTVRSGASTGASHQIVRHRESGVGQDGDAVSFSEQYENAPTMTFVPQSAKTFSTFSTASQFVDMRALSLTTTGFTLRAKILVSQAGTTVNEGWSTAQGGVSTGQGDKTMTTGETFVFSRLESATTEVAEYETYFDVNAVNLPQSVLATVTAYYNDSTGGTSWTAAGAKTYDSLSNVTNQRIGFSVALAANRDLRLGLSYESTEPSSSGRATVTAHGSTNAVPGVQFTAVSTGFSEESMTPNASNKIAWIAVEAP